MAMRQLRVYTEPDLKVRDFAAVEECGDPGVRVSLGEILRCWPTPSPAAAPGSPTSPTTKSRSRRTSTTCSRPTGTSAAPAPERPGLLRAARSHAGSAGFQPGGSRAAHYEEPPSPRQEAPSGSEGIEGGGGWRPVPISEAHPVAGARGLLNAIDLSESHGIQGHRATRVIRFTRDPRAAAVQAQRREAWGEPPHDAASSVIGPRPYGRSAFTCHALEREDHVGAVWPVSDVEVLDVEGVLLDEIATGLDLFAHQHAEQVVGRGGVGHGDP